MPTLSLFWLRVICWSVLAAALAGSGAAFVHHQREIGAAPEREKAQRAAAAASQAGVDLAETIRRGKTIQEAQDAEFIARQAAQADAAALRASRDSLRQRTAAIASQCSGADTAAAGSSTPASSPGDLLADVQARLEEAAGQLADAADNSRRAGQLCERSYDALTAPK